MSNRRWIGYKYLAAAGVIVGVTISIWWIVEMVKEYVL